MADVNGFICHICNAIFNEEQALLDHFCPGAPAESDAS
jgi:hypothetical protein